MKRLLYISAIFLSLSVNLQAAKSDFTFLVFSDIHETANTSPNAYIKPTMLADLARQEANPSALILTGDLTDNGGDDQFHAFVTNWLDPFSKLMSAKPHNGIYLCKGNHDEASGSNSAVLNYLKQEYGGFCYSFDIEGVHFACCAKYPQKTIIGGELSWLKSDLKKVPAGTPIVIFFHYNILGAFSDWWSVSCGSCICTSAKSEKDYFFDAIKDYNIQCIFFGHLHMSYSALWRNKFRLACVAGDKYAMCHFSQATNQLEVIFKDSHGRLYDWDDPDILHNELDEL